MDKQTEKLMKEEQKFFGVQPGFKLMTPGVFSGMNQYASRMMMKNEEFFWCENFVKIGDGYLRTLWDKGTAIYNVPTGKKIVYFYFFNIAATNYAAVFLSDGTAIQVNSATLATASISSVANTFYNTSISTQLPICGQWGAQYLLIANNITPNSYWVWDGSIFYTAGSIAPQVTITSAGAGYSQSTAAVAAYGGHGTGATFSATVTNGSITSIQITNPGSGYIPTDIVQLWITGGNSTTPKLTAVLTASTVQTISVSNPGSGYTVATVSISGGGGTGATATATIVNGAITGITVTVAGSGFTDSPVVTISGDGTGATAYAFLAVTSVASVTVVYGGSSLGAVTLSFAGGGGTGATATATMTSGAITSVTVSSGGSLYTSAPAVVAGGSLGSAATASLTLMPYGVSGSSIETFQERVWLPYPNQSNGQVNGGTFLVSSPGSFSDFSTADGGLIFVNSDAFLRAQYTNIKQSNGYLYPIGDSSVSLVSNVQTSGNASLTTFNYQNTDPQIGTSWRDTCQSFSRTILFGNQFGIFGLYGGSVTKVSTPIDNLFTAATSNGIYTGSFNPSGAVANIYSKKMYLFLFSTVDQTTQANRTIMLVWDEKNWYVASQTANLIFIGTQEINSNLTAYGTDGSALYPLFNSPSASLTKKLSTKLYGGDNPLIQKASMGVYAQVQDKSSTLSGVTFSTFTVDSESGSYSIPTIPVFPSNSGPPYNPIVSAGSGDVFGVNLGMTITSNSQDFVLKMLGLGIVEAGTIAMGATNITGNINTE